jgi:hypothetical protein
MEVQKLNNIFKGILKSSLFFKLENVFNDSNTDALNLLVDDKFVCNQYFGRSTEVSDVGKSLSYINT